MLEIQRSNEQGADEPLGFARRLLLLHALLLVLGLSALLLTGQIWAASVLAIWALISVFWVATVRAGWLGQVRVLALWAALPPPAVVALLQWHLDAQSAGLSLLAEGGLRLGLGLMAVGYALLALMLWRSRRMERATRHCFRPRP